jgi:O-antigen ligase
LAVTYGAWVIDRVRNRRAPRPTPVLAGALFFLATLVLSIALGPEDSGSSDIKLLPYAGFVMLPWLTEDVFESPRQLCGLVRAWLLGMTITIIVAVVAIVAFYVVDRDVLTSVGCSYGRLPAGWYPRVCLPFRNPNMMANYLTVVIPLTIGCGGLLFPGKWRTVVFVAAMVAAASTLSTGLGGLALSVAITIYAMTRRSTARRGGLGGALMVTAIAGAILMTVATVGTFVPKGYGHITVGGSEFNFIKNGRVHTWLSAINTISQHPVTGIGYGALVAVTPPGGPPENLRPWIEGRLEPFDDSRPLTAEAHSVVLSVAAQAGVLGLAAFFFLLFQVVRRSTFREWDGSDALRYLPAALAAGLIGAVAYHGWFVAIEEARHFWAALGLTAAAHHVRATRLLAFDDARTTRDAGPRGAARGGARG